MQDLPIRFIDEKQLVDNFQRRYQYLRLSITDACNFRCNYCLPNGYQNNPHSDFLNISEIDHLVRAFTALGTEKVRLSGGEPTIRCDFNQIAETIRKNPQIKKLALTTNGYRMQKDVASWRQSGVDNINVSIDSLNREMFRRIAGKDLLPQILAGIDRAFSVGYKHIKVNAVLMKGFNDREITQFLEWIKDQPIQIRFIELMQTGDMDVFFDKHHLAGFEIKQRLLREGWTQKTRGHLDGPAEVFIHPEYIGEIGLIMPYSKDFCKSCNRLRVASNGEFHLCLFGEEGLNIRHLLQNDTQRSLLKNTLQVALRHKRENHLLHEGDAGIRPHLASIGG